MKTPLHYLVRYPSANLLFIQLLGLLLYPLVEHQEHGRALVGAFGIIVLATALRMVRRSPTIQWLGFILAGCILVLTVLIEWQGEHQLVLALAILDAIFYFYTAGSLIAYMMEDQRATTDELFAVGATFTLLAWAFAHAFSACQILLPGSFTAAVDSAAPRSWTELLYVSFAILSGVGLSDIYPVRPMARSLVMLGQFSGVMYIALVVTRLVTLTVRNR
ncbi:MAG: ion channel [Pseudomonas oryzihabitans]